MRRSFYGFTLAFLSLLIFLPVACNAKKAVVTTFAGSPRVSGSKDGIGTAALFKNPMGIATDTLGNIYVADSGNSLIRKITPSGLVTTLAGSAGVTGSTDGPGKTALFDGPTGVAVDVSGNIYVADVGNNSIRKITPAGLVTTLAGGDGPMGDESGFVNGMGTAASFALPVGVAVDALGNVYVADLSNNAIRKITPNGVVTTLAGSGKQGRKDAIGSEASFMGPEGVAVDNSGNVYVSDTYNNLIRKITSDGVVTTLAGSSPDHPNGTGRLFYDPVGIAIDTTGNIYVADLVNNLIRKITPSGRVTILAGQVGSVYGSANGLGTESSFTNPYSVAVDSSGNVYVADGGNNLIRKITQ